MPSLADLGQPPTGTTLNNASLAGAARKRKVFTDWAGVPLPDAPSPVATTQAITAAQGPSADQLINEAKGTLGRANQLTDSVGGLPFERAAALQAAHPDAYGHLSLDEIETALTQKEQDARGHQGYHPGLADSRGVKDPLTGNPLWAELKGFGSGASEAATPATIASTTAPLGFAGVIPAAAMNLAASVGRHYFDTPNRDDADAAPLGMAEAVSGPVLAGSAAKGISKIPGALRKVAPAAGKLSPKVTGGAGAVMGGVEGYRRGGVLGAAEGALTGGVLGSQVPTSVRALQALTAAPAEAAAVEAAGGEAAFTGASRVTPTPYRPGAGWTPNTPVQSEEIPYYRSPARPAKPVYGEDVLDSMNQHKAEGFGDRAVDFIHKGESKAAQKWRQQVTNARNTLQATPTDPRDPAVLPKNAPTTGQGAKSDQYDDIVKRGLRNAFNRAGK